MMRFRRESGAAMPGRFWPRSFAAVASLAAQALDDLWGLLMVASADELRPPDSGYSGAALFSFPTIPGCLDWQFAPVAGSAMAANAVRTETSARRSFLCAHGLSIEQCQLVVHSRTEPAQISALRSVVATWMHLAIFEAPEPARGARSEAVVCRRRTRRVRGAIDGLKDALTRLRKFGGRCILRFQ